MQQLPAQKPGEFLLISPDNFERTRPMRTRWLYTRHETLDEERIEQLSDERWRERFPLTPTQSAEPESPIPATAAAPPPPTKSPAPKASSEEEQGADQKQKQQIDILAAAPSMTTAEFAERAGLSDSSARTILKRLVKAGLADQFMPATPSGARPARCPHPHYRCPEWIHSGLVSRCGACGVLSSARTLS